MSITAMVNAGLGRRPDFRPLNTVPKSPAEIAAAAKSAPASQTSVSDAMDVVTTYIPTEVIALYVAFIGVLGQGSSNANLGWWGTIVFCSLPLPSSG